MSESHLEETVHIHHFSHGVSKSHLEATVHIVSIVTWVVSCWNPTWKWQYALLVSSLKSCHVKISPGNDSMHCWVSSLASCHVRISPGADCMHCWVSSLESGHVRISPRADYALRSIVTWLGFPMSCKNLQNPGSSQGVGITLHCHHHSTLIKKGSDWWELV